MTWKRFGKTVLPEKVALLRLRISILKNSKYNLRLKSKTLHQKNIWTETKSNEATFSHNSRSTHLLKQWKILVWTWQASILLILV